MRVHDVACVRRDMCSGCNCARSRALSADSLVHCCCAFFSVPVNTIAMPVPLLPICNTRCDREVLAYHGVRFAGDLPQQFLWTLLR